MHRGLTRNIEWVPLLARIDIP